ncbi:MAG: hypothetical protein PVF17_07350, partial [Ignavibacteria bacterium]
EWADVVSQLVLDYGNAEAWDEMAVFNPTVIKDGDTLKMWYTGTSDYLLYANKRIGYAWSVDGTTWYKLEYNLVLEPTLPWENSSVSTGTVIKDGDTLKMWYNAGGNFYDKVGYATSIDGVNWNKHSGYVLEQGPPDAWDASYINPGAVIKDDSVYIMWYWAGKYTYILEADYQIGYAISMDGINWIKYNDTTTTTSLYAESDPVLMYGNTNDWDERRVWHMTVLPTESGFEMWFSGYNDHHIYDEVGYATSSDGKVWQKWLSNPIFNSSPSWGNGRIADAVLKFDEYYHMWFTSYQFTHGMGNYQAKIGYAISQSTVNVGTTDMISTIPEQIELYQNFPNPFNPATTIRYRIPESSIVTVKLYDILGTEVATLVNAEKPAGRHEYILDGSILAGSIYFYELRAG